MISLRQYLVEQSVNFNTQLDARLFDARLKFITSVKNELNTIGAVDVEWSDETEELIDAGRNGSLSYTLENVAISLNYQGSQVVLRFSKKPLCAICSIWNEKTKHLELSEPLPTIQHVKRWIDHKISK